ARLVDTGTAYRVGLATVGALMISGCDPLFDLLDAEAFLLFGFRLLRRPGLPRRRAIGLRFHSRAPRKRFGKHAPPRGGYHVMQLLPRTSAPSGPTPGTRPTPAA